MACRQYFPPWPCPGGGGGGGTVSANVCDTLCVEYNRCFNEDACAYVAHTTYAPDYIWSGPYTFGNNITAAGSCRQCFPKWSCWLATTLNILSSLIYKTSSCDVEFCRPLSWCFTSHSCAVYSGKRFLHSAYGFVCDFVVQRCRRCFPQWACNMPRSPPSPLPLLNHTALSLLANFCWIPEAMCNTEFVSCGVVNESLRVVGLDIDSGLRYWDSRGPPVELSIEALQDISALTFLRLPRGLHGDSEMLRSLEQLTHLRLSGQGITGSLNTRAPAAEIPCAPKYERWRIFSCVTATLRFGSARN